MAKPKKPDPKSLELKRTATLNPRPDSIADPLFKENPFFDPKDLLQVRYEMLRRHRVEGASVVEVASQFGVSRPTLVSSPGCLRASWPERTSAQAARPQTGAQDQCRDNRVCTVVACRRPWADDGWCSAGYQGTIRHHGSSPQSGAGFGEQKKTAQSGVSSLPPGTVEAYEGLRQEVVQPERLGAHPEGRGVLMRCGLATWAQIRLDGSRPSSHSSSPLWDFNLRSRHHWNGTGPACSRSDSQHSTGGFSAWLS